MLSQKTFSPLYSIESNQTGQVKLMDLLNVLIAVYLPDGLLFLPHCRQNYHDLVKQEFRPQTYKTIIFRSPGFAKAAI